MRESSRWASFGVVVALGCGGGEAAEPVEPEPSVGAEVEVQEPPPSAPVVARFEGALETAERIVVELDASGGGVVTYPESGRAQTLSGCAPTGTTLACRATADGFAGDIELTHREDRSGVEGRLRSDADGTWTAFSADTVAVP